MNWLKTQNVLAPLMLTMALVVASCGGDGAGAEKAGAEAEHGEEAGEAAGHEEEGPDRVTITAAAAQEAGIGVSTAGPGPIRETLNLTGRVMLQSAGRAEIRAPYPGVVRSVAKNVGDTVRRGEVLARVESAESLQTYSIVAPIGGVVLERGTNVGDVSGNDPLFIVGDLTRLQAELNVVTHDIDRVAGGQTVLISGLDGEARVEARIATVLPTTDTHSQTLIARAPIAARGAANLRPGMAIRGAVVLSEQRVPLAIAAGAVQTLEGRSVVFVRTGEVYEARPVALGRSGSDMVEVTAGLRVGEIYVSANAFLIKAEIGKGAAEHGH
ncbi:MAG: HlyD family efflux transporter periplasmic adaptor subunit [Terricaulis sp.]